VGTGSRKENASNKKLPTAVVLRSGYAGIGLRICVSKGGAATLTQRLPCFETIGYADPSA
jgi:hypothetical protein